jgi:hypothetical protein
MLIATFAYILLEKVIAAQGEPGHGQPKRAVTARDRISALCFLIAVPAPYLHPALAFALILTGALFYFLPNASMQR